MRLRRTAIIAAVLCTLSASAGAVVVFDPLNTLEHSFLNGWRESIGAVLTQQLDRVRQMAQAPQRRHESREICRTRRSAVAHASDR